MKYLAGQAKLAFIERLEDSSEERLQQQREKAFRQGFEDFARGRPRNRPPYGFTDLKEAWRKGWDKRSKGLALGA